MFCRPRLSVSSGVDRLWLLILVSIVMGIMLVDSALRARSAYAGRCRQ